MRRTVEDLREELKNICEETNTRYSGIEYLVNYYIKSLGWTEEQAIEYAIRLFHDGTIKEIQIFGKDGEQL